MAAQILQLETTTRQGVSALGRPLLAENSSEAYVACRYFFKDHNRIRSNLELHGLGKEIWEEIDAQEYVNSLREEWNHRP